MADDKQSGSEEKTFWGHLEDLRKVLFRMAATVFALFLVLFYFMPYLFDNVIMAPCNGDFPLYRFFAWVTAQFPALPQFTTEGYHVDLINTRLASKFFTHISASFWSSLVLGFPILIYLLWGFVRPALYPGERRGAEIAFVGGTVLFYVGVAVGYFLVFPITLRFLYQYQLSGNITNMLTLDSYMDNFMMLNLVMGLVFELPLLAWVLSLMGIVRRSFFRRFRRHAVVVLLIVAALITPTGDPITLLIVFLPLYLLYEGSALIVKRDEPTD